MRLYWFSILRAMPFFLPFFQKRDRYTCQGGMGCQAGRFRILEFGFWIGCSNDFGFWILDFGLGALPKLNTQSKI